jgi:hypothetical protein
MSTKIREFHRFLDLGDSITGRKAIIGSFSVTSLTRHFDGINSFRKGESKLDFFYGSSRNQFWPWYQQYVDTKIDTTDKKVILKSLKKNKITITDLIQSCERKGSSALDSSLSKIAWNFTGIMRLLDNDVNTFLCTSKWVMQKLEMHVLRKTGYNYNHDESAKIQERIFPFLDTTILSFKPLVGVYYNHQKRIYIIALPTPGGGTFRKLNTYGYNSKSKFTAKEFVHLYLTAAFNYFLSC